MPLWSMTESLLTLLISIFYKYLSSICNCGLRVRLDRPYNYNLPLASNKVTSFSHHVKSLHVMWCHVTSWLVTSSLHMTCYDVTGHDVTWLGMARHDLSCRVTPCHVLSWHDITWHARTWPSEIWHFMTQQDGSWHDHDVMTWYDVTCDDLTQLRMTWHGTTWRDITWQVSQNLNLVPSSSHASFSFLAYSTNWDYKSATLQLF